MLPTRVLLAQPFDAKNLSISGEPVRVADGLAVSDQNTRVVASVSGTGVLVYRTGSAGIQTQLAWYDRTGKLLGTVGSPGQYRGIALSPDDTHIAVHVHQEPTGGDIWIFDQARGTNTRFTFTPSHNLVPTWSRDGSKLAFSSDREGGVGAIFEKSASGAGEERLLFKPPTGGFPEDWTPDQQVQSLGQGTPGRGMGIWTVRPGESNAMPLVETEFSDILSKFSPDGRWSAW